MGVVYIYGLYDPRTGELRYVGKTHQTLQMRLKRHMDDARRPAKASRHVYRWIGMLQRYNAMPVIRVIEVTDQEHWEERERYWIKHYRESGARLCNHADGGAGKPTKQKNPLTRRYRPSHRKRRKRRK